MLKKSEIYFILVALCLLVYANSLNGAFVSDDIFGIVESPYISQPLRFLLVPSQLLNSLNYLIAGGNPFVYHLTSIFIHSLNTILVFLFLQAFFKAQTAFLGAALFAVHPIHAEAVTWISGRPYLLLALFILGIYFLYNKAVKKGAPPQVKEGGINIFYYLLSLLLFLYYIIQNFAFIFLFPLFLILSDLTFGRWRKNWIWWVPFFVITAARVISVKAVIVTRISQVAKDYGSAPNQSNPLFNMAYSLFSHLSLLVWPAKLTLYHEPAVITSFHLTLEIIFLFILILILPFIFKKARVVFFAIALFILFLAPTYSPWQVSWLVAERYLYFPSVALCIFTGFLYEIYIGKGEKNKRLATIVFILIITAYAVRTVARNEDWKTSERLWRETVKVSYNSPRAHNNMGDVYSREGNSVGAIREFKKAIDLKPNYPEAFHNLATVYYAQGGFAEAEKLYQQAISFNPQLFESQYNLGLVYLNKNECTLAGEYLRKALALRPHNTNVRNALGLVYRKLNEQKIKDELLNNPKK